MEDDPGDALKLQALLCCQDGAAHQITHVERLHDALQQLLQKRQDIVLLDLSLPESKDLDPLQQLQSAAPDVPLIVLTTGEEDALALRAIHAGAQDFLIKGQLGTAEALRVLRSARERHRVRRKLEELVVMDELTRLPNRRGFLSLAEQQLKLLRRKGGFLLLAFVDVDDLKRINDTFGHAEGDRALLETADILRESFRHSDIVGRIGGDEFVALGIEASAEGIQVLRRRIDESLARCNAHPGRRYPLSLSVGIGLFGAERQGTIEQFVEAADALMYKQKHARGPNGSNHNGPHGESAASISAGVADAASAPDRGVSPKRSDHPHDVHCSASGRSAELLTGRVPAGIAVHGVEPAHSEDRPTVRTLRRCGSPAGDIET